MQVTRIVQGVRPSSQTPRQIDYEFRRLLNGGLPVRASGRAQADPTRLLSMGYTPKHKVQLFDTTYYLTNMRYDDDLRFMVAYVITSNPGAHPGAHERRGIHPRMFYKDSSLVWRSPTHYIRSENENWIGKGDLKCLFQGGDELEYTAEETTNLPLEIQAALDAVSVKSKRRFWDDDAVGLILRQAPVGRFEPYHDFSGPRRAAMSDPSNRINGGKYVAYFAAENDPTSLRFVAGFEPDFESGVLEVANLKSRYYAGRVRKYRILSRNKTIQYQFVATPKQVWIIPPQALSTQIMSYGVRTLDVNADENLFVPGYEFHYLDDSMDPPRLYSQIPAGFVGEAHEYDPARRSASPWLEQLPIIRRFRRSFSIPVPTL